METVLTAVVTRLLKKFVKTKANKQGEDLRVRLTNGRVVLHNLELNLKALGLNQDDDNDNDNDKGKESGGLVTVRRAFAKELSVNIPWTALSTDAIEVCLDTVEVVLDVRDKSSSEDGQVDGGSNNRGARESPSGRSASAASNDARGEEDEDRGGQESRGREEEAPGGKETAAVVEDTKKKKGWISSLLDTLGDTSVRIRNLVLRLRCGSTVTTVMCGELKVFTSFRDEAGVLGGGDLNLDPKGFFSKWVVASTVMMDVTNTAAREDGGEMLGVLNGPAVNMDGLKFHLVVPSPFTLSKSMSVEDLRGLDEQRLPQGATEPQVNVFFDELTCNASRGLAEAISLLLEAFRQKGEPEAEEGPTRPASPSSGSTTAGEEERDAVDLVPNGGERGLEEAPEPAEESKPRSTWLSYGTSVASKTWDFIVAGEDEDMEWEGHNASLEAALTAEEVQMQKDLEEKMSKLWLKFNISVRVNKAKLNLVAETKRVTVSLEGLWTRLPYSRESLGEFSASIARIKVDHSRGARQEGSNQLVFLCSASQKPSEEVRAESALDIHSSIVVREAEEGSRRLFSVSVGETWLLYNSKFVEDACDILRQMSAALRPRRAEGDDEPAPAHDDDTKAKASERNGEAGREGGGVQVKLTMASTTLSCDDGTHYSVLSHVGALVENVQCTFVLDGVAEDKTAEVDLSAMVYLVQLKRLSPEHFIRNYLSRAAILKGEAKYGAGNLDAVSSLEEFECCLESHRFDDLLESVCGYDHLLMESMKRTLEGLYSNVSGLKFSFAKGPSVDTRAHISIDAVLLGLFLNATEHAGVNALLVEVGGVDCLAEGPGKAAAVNSVACCLSRDNTGVACNTLLKSSMSTEGQIERNVIVHTLAISFGEDTSIGLEQVVSKLSGGDLECLLTVSGFASEVLPERGADEEEMSMLIKVDKTLLEICDESQNQSLSVAIGGISLKKSLETVREGSQMHRTEESSMDLQVATVAVTHNCDDKGGTLVLHFERGLGESPQEVDLSLTSVSTFSTASKTVEKQVEARAGNPFTCCITPVMLTMVLDVLTRCSGPRKAAGETKGAEAEKVVRNSCTKVSLKEFGLYFDGFHYEAAAGERLHLHSDALILAIIPAQDDSTQKKSTEIDVCTLSFQISTMKPSFEQKPREFVFLGPADMHWKWQNLESFVLSINAGCLPLHLYWGAHRIIHSAFYGLFRVIYDGWQAIKAKSSAPQEGGEKEEPGDEGAEKPPFLLVVLQSGDMHLDLQSKVPSPAFLGAEGKPDLFLGSLLKLVSKSFKLGFHLWSSSNYLFTFMGLCEFVYENPSTFTEEVLMMEVPVKASLGFMYEAGGGVAQRPIARSLRTSAFAPPDLLRVQNTSRQEVSFEVFTEEKVHLLASMGAVNKFLALQAHLNGVENIHIRNFAPIDIAIGQVGSGGRGRRLPTGSTCDFVWPCPHILVNEKSELLHVRVEADHCPWSNAFGLKKEGCSLLVLPISDTHELELAAQISKASGHVEVTLRPRHCIINSTPEDLQVTWEGCLSGCSGVLEQALDTRSFCLHPRGESAEEANAEEVLLLCARSSGGSSSPRLSLRSGGTRWESVKFGKSVASFPVRALADHGDQAAPKAINDLFVECLSSHLATGQVLVRIHPNLYLTNGLTEEIRIEDPSRGTPVCIPSSETVPLMGVDLEALHVSIAGPGAAKFSGKWDCSGKVGWSELEFIPAEGARLPTLKCLCHTESVHDGALAFMRIVPEVSFQNCTGLKMGASFVTESDHGEGEDRPKICVLADETLHSFPGSGTESWLVSLSLEGGGNQKPSQCVLNLTDLQSCDQESPRRAFSRRVGFRDSGLKLYLSAARTALTERVSQGPSIFHIGIFPLFSVMNLCRRDIVLKCSTNSTEVHCEKGEIAGLAAFDCKAEAAGDECVSLQMRWIQEHGEAECDGGWSDPAEISCGAGFALTSIPQGTMGGEGGGGDGTPSRIGGVPVSLYTFEYGGRFVTLVSEEAFPPFVFENQSDTVFEIWLTNREGASIEDANPSDFFDLPAGLVSKDFGAHFAHLCVSNKNARKAEIAEAGEDDDDIFNAEVETILSLVNKVPINSSIRMFFRPKGSSDPWSNKGLAERSSKAEFGVVISTDYNAPTWLVTFCFDGDSGEHLGGEERGGSKRKQSLKGVSLDLRGLQVTLVEPGEDESESHRCQILVNRFHFCVERWTGSSKVEETLHRLDMTWDAVQIGIGRPSRAVLWTSSSSREIFCVRALLRSHSSALPADPGEGKRARIFSLDEALIQLARMNVSIDDKVLLFFSRLQSKFFHKSDLLPLGRFLLDKGNGPESLQRVAAKHVRGIFRSSGVGKVHIGKLVIHKLQVICTFRSSGLVPIFPYTVDVVNSPIVLQGMCLEGIYAKPKLLVHAIAAYYVAEGIANAPQIVGSLGLLFNPVGIVESVKNGVHDLIGIPLEGLKAGNPLNFVGGLGLGGLKFIGHVSGSLLSSVSVFSSASARILQKLYRSPEVGGLGLLGFLASPIGGALQLIGDVTQGVLDTTGFTDMPAAMEAPEDLVAVSRSGDGRGRFVASSTKNRFLVLCTHLEGEGYRGHFPLVRGARVLGTGEDPNGSGDASTVDLVANPLLLVTAKAYHLVSDGSFSLDSRSLAVGPSSRVDSGPNNSVKIVGECGLVFDLTFDSFQMQAFFQVLKSL
ncbi:hypothetical protein HOP50_09g53870 [Chloropicon primus]|nr:hypothetical protein HOP50_09g53870 [Chloropicon primus]